MGLLHRTAQIAEEYLAMLPERRVGASLGFEDVLASLGGRIDELTQAQRAYLTSWRGS